MKLFFISKCLIFKTFLSSPAFHARVIEALSASLFVDDEFIWRRHPNGKVTILDGCNLFFSFRIKTLNIVITRRIIGTSIISKATAFDCFSSKSHFSKINLSISLYICCSFLYIPCIVSDLHLLCVHMLNLYHFLHHLCLSDGLHQTDNLVFKCESQYCLPSI